MITLYYNDGCSKCRETLNILQESNQPFQTVEYLKTPPTEAVLDSLLMQLNLEPEQIVRKGEDEYEAMEAQGKLPRDRQSWLRAMVAQPILIERPIVSDGKSAVVGRPPSKVSDWLIAR